MRATLLAFSATMLTPALALCQVQQNQPHDPDMRAATLAQGLSDDEKERLIVSALSLQSAGIIRGVPEKGIPAIRETDSTVGVFRWLTDTQYVSLPSAAGMAATWNPDLVSSAYAMVAREARNSAMTVLLAPAVNLVRELRNGRTYEYFGEDPLLAGTMAAAAVRGIQREKVIATLKHFALNDQESGRHYINAVIGDAAMRESDLLAFQMGIEAQPGSVMCSYNKVNGTYACQNKYLLTDILKTEWGFKGWVMTDWGAQTDPVTSALAGLDQISAGVTEQGNPNPFFGKVPDFGQPLRQAIASGSVPASRRDDMVHRILRSMFAVDVIDQPAVEKTQDFKSDIDVARRTEQEAIVLLRNDGVLPLSPRIRSIAIIGGRADTSVISKITAMPGDRKKPFGEPPPLDGKAPVVVPVERPVLWAHSSPLRALRAILPDTTITYSDGKDINAAKALAKTSDVTVIFAIQDTHEGEDLRSLRLNSGQEALITAVSAASKETVVVLENGTAVAMPWASQTNAILAAWFPGSGGGEAIADILSGKTNPSGRLPISFPLDERDQPRPDVPGIPSGNSNDNQITTMGSKQEQTVEVDYRIEGSDVGYRWLHKTRKPAAFPFGHGLSYTTFKYGDLAVRRNDGSTTVSFSVENTGRRAGKETAQIYLAEPFRLIGYRKVELKPRQKREVIISIDHRMISNWNEKVNSWKLIRGPRQILIGSSSQDIKITSNNQLSF